jgi:hypothetical protein
MLLVLYEGEMDAMLANVQSKTDFVLNNHENISHRLSMIMGEKGILLGFTGDVWDLNCVRYVLWTQRQNFKLNSYGVNAALVIPNHCHELNGFFMSIPRDINFPLLADPNYTVYHDFDMAMPGFVLLSRDGETLGKWYITDTSSLSVKAVLDRL